MALNINGTTGISGVDGSASAPALTGTDSNTGINFASDTVNINTGGQTRATVDSNGRLGVATSSPNTFAIATFNDSNGISLTGSTQTRLVMTHQNGGSEQKNFDIQLSDGALKFRKIGDNNTTVTERARITSDGKFYLGTTDGNNMGSKVVIDSTSNDIFAVKYSSEAGSGLAQVIKGFVSGTPSGTCNFIQFQRNDANVRGSITANGAANLSFNTSSDYRLKENVVAISDGITRLKTLKPSRFNWKEDTNTTVDGFLAHEVSTAIPEAVTGTKDAVDENGKIIIQQLDQSKLVPLLTAALQEAIAKIEVLETKVAALEAG